MRLRVHPAVNHMQKMLANIPEKTGLSLSQWKDEFEVNAISTESTARKYIKSEHPDVGGGFARVITGYIFGDLADYDEKQNIASAPDKVDAQYEGKKSHMREWLNALVTKIEELGGDVAFSPCKTYVPVYKDHVIAQIKATTQKRIDLGLALAKYRGEMPARLIDTGGKDKGDRITHRIAISDIKDIDSEVVHWLRTAYALDA